MYYLSLTATFHFFSNNVAQAPLQAPAPAPALAPASAPAPALAPAPADVVGGFGSCKKKAIPTLQHF